MNEKRRGRSYKIADKHYDKAMKRAKREKMPLAKLIENVIKAYSDGLDRPDLTKIHEVYR